MTARLVPLACALLMIATGSSFADKPNVLLIAVDDLNDWVSCMGGHPQAKTPNIDRLADRGILFTNAHCQGTMCNPSRISILWGMRPSSTGFYDNHYAVGREPSFLERHVSLPRHFEAAGYKTLTTGKIFHGGAPQQSQVVGHAQGSGGRTMTGQFMRSLPGGMPPGISALNATTKRSSSIISLPVGRFSNLARGTRNRSFSPSVSTVPMFRSFRRYVCTTRSITRNYHE
jgi:hypothetical protein